MKVPRTQTNRATQRIPLADEGVKHRQTKRLAIELVCFLEIYKRSVNVKTENSQCCPWPYSIIVSYRDLKISGNPHKSVH
jgi:hypothetical protein